jgi:hypothetical protein
MTISVYPPLGSSINNAITVQYGGAQLDAFGRLRISQPYTLFDSQNRYVSDAQFDTSTGTGGSTTFLTNESTLRMDVTTSSGSYVYRQSYRSFHYQPGKSLLVLATFVMNTAKTGLRQRVGYFNTQNGVFFQQDGTTKSFVLRSYVTGSVSDARTENQSAWNGDKLDGTGPSGLTLDTTKAQILFMDFEWLGVGSVRCGFIINGQYIICHTFNNANLISNVYMTTAILPIRYEIENTAGTASSSSLKQICSSVMSEGGYDSVDALSVARRTTQLSNIDTTFLPLISIRLKSTRLGAVVLPHVYQFLPVTSQNYEVVLTKNPTLTGSPSWVTSDFENVEYDVSATGYTGGTIVQSDFVTSSAQGRAVLTAPTGYNWDLQIGASIAGTSDIYTVGVRIVSGATKGDGFASFSFYDLTDGL